MATLYQSPCFFSLSSRKIFLNQEDFKINWNTLHQHYYYPSQKHFKICLCQANKSRGRRKVKSDTELCNDIREFVSAVGFPEGHVPSMKELSSHGRKDLAHIVRRRGYKLIKELLSKSIDAQTDEFNVSKSSDEGQDVINGHAEIQAEGQGEKVEDIVEDSSLSTEVTIIHDRSDFASIVPECSSSDHSSMPTESLVEDVTSLTPLYNMEQQDTWEAELAVEESSLSFSHDNAKQQDAEVLSTTEDSSLSAVAPVMDSSYSGLNGYNCVNSDIDTCMTVETSVNSSSDEKALNDSAVYDEKVNNTAEEVSFSDGENSEYRVNNNSVSGLNFADDSRTNVTSYANLSLEDKVARFIQNGDLDDIEDNVHGMLDGSSEESEECNQPKNNIEIQSKISSEENLAHAVSSTLNGILTSEEDSLSPARTNHPTRDDSLSAESLAGSDLDEDFDVKTSKGENQVEIDHLKSMLHQKELELSRLKEQIKQEQLALSDLQTKAEMEITKAQKLISEKDAELFAAEESLSGLAEVEIQYNGDGEIVEVAGSFNGWHERIKMDPQPFSSVITDSRTRKSKLWSTMLWLYPGKYEIKFIVDGHWRIDPQRESVTRGGISNNVLRVGG